jgi:hypothetical protein
MATMTRRYLVIANQTTGSEDRVGVTRVAGLYARRTSMMCSCTP